MSYRSAIESVYALVAAVGRSTEVDAPFHTVEDPAGGHVVPVDEVPDDVSRLFDIRMTVPPQDDGGSGYVYTRFRVGLELRVRYSLRARALAEVMIAEDVGALCNALVHPSGWATDIDTIPPPGAPRLEVLTNSAGVDVALLLVLPFEVLYRHTPPAI